MTLESSQFLAVAAFAAFAANATGKATLSPVRAELNALKDVALTVQAGPKLDEINKRVSYLSRMERRIRYRSAKGGDAKRRWALTWFVLTGLFSLVINAAPAPGMGILTCAVLTLLWPIVCTDFVSRDVLDRDAFILTLACAAITGFGSPDIRWARPDEALIALAMIGALILAITIYGKLRNLWFEKEPVIFGSGDVLVLMGLSLFFGVDILLVVLLSSVVFITFVLVCRLAWGDADKYRPFVPAIFVGAVLMVMLRFALPDLFVLFSSKVSPDFY